ncbi:hypothetical protein EPUS_05186 [Endocarpon pusillum Z07020]|uniref:NB-ARC domain-containing protein n=1 Tax=Endocarpon pusillum (strain Z07020 / HMAS-L-300199) TaxID=1263415 RepID=U1FZJ7_ENDPU|nr:uncharacterized protein EPUS_05186 [Endocarpon pusillum Z07020]ERF70367.1 hypothetical protein EPUS_05186 [Endocarpon pusillum Z07020]
MAQPALPALKKLGHDDYGVAIICPLEVEVSAVRYMLNEEHARLPNKEGDSNRYICGRMSGHNVVIGFLPEGSQGATLRLLVGIGGGVPSVQNDVRLGDVVVSMPSGGHGGVVQYDLGKETPTGFERKGFLEPPPTSWRTCVVDMKSAHRTKANQISTFLDDMIRKYPGLDEYRRLTTAKDVLFLPTNKHASGETTCQKCDHSQVVERPPRARDTPTIFYGLIASGNRIAQDAGGALCFEMEAAGLMNDFRCVVIRGISDYADSHKNDDWHAYSAAVAAGCAKELLTYMNSVVGSNSTSRNVHWTITRVTNPYFTGRADIVTEITEVVQNALQDDTGMDQCRIVVTGMGGQGKSEICLHVADRVRSSFWGVFWVDVDKVALAESGFRAIGSRLNLPAPSIDDVRQSLANIKHRWLLILDNADARDVDYQQYFPTGCTGVIVLTSRNSKCHQYATRKSITLDGLLPHDASNLFLQAAQIPRSQHEACKQDADFVATSLLKGHPLALIQAGAYVSRGHCSIAAYPSVFHRQRKRLLSFRPEQAQSRYGDVYATFEASADVLQSSHKEAASDALQLLPVLAMLASTPLPLSLFEVVWEVMWHVSQLLPLLEADGGAWDSFRLVEAVRLLEVYSLVVVNGAGDTMSVSMHALTHAWAKDRQEPKLQRQSWLRTGCVIAVTTEGWLSARRSFWQERQTQLRPHLQALVSVGTSVMFDNELQLMIVRILLRCGWILNLLQIDTELFTLMRQLFIWLNLDDLTVTEKWLPLYGLYGDYLNQCTKSKAAVTVLEQVVTIREQTLAENHPDQLESQHALAIAYKDNGQVEKAMKLL